MESIIKRLNQLPEKNFIEFLNLYGIKLIASQSASAPVTFRLSDRVKSDVIVPKGTQLLASADDNELLFKTKNDVLVTQAKIVKAFSYDNYNDSIFDISKDIKSQKLQTFDNLNDLQQHELYLGNSNLLNIKNKFTVIVRFFISNNEYLDELVNFLNSEKIHWHIFQADSESGKKQTIPLLKKVLGSKATDPASNSFIHIELWPEHEISEIKDSIVQNHTSKWLKCLFDISKQDLTKFSTLFTIKKIELDVKTENENEPEKLFFNDLPIEPKINFPPLGTRPYTNGKFYITHSDIFSKKGYEIELKLYHKTEAALKSDPLNDRILVWEFWNGRNWIELPLKENFFDKSTKILTVKFVCPDNFETTEVNGHTKFWLRVRLAAGDYGTEKFTVSKVGSDEWVTTKTPDSIKPPFIEKIKINLLNSISTISPMHCFSKNNLSFEEWDKETVFYPLKFLGETNDNIFIGFDKPLSKGPIQIFFDIEKETDIQLVPTKSNFYYFDNEWKKLEHEDETNGFTKTGIVRLQYPLNVQKSKKFGDELYWFRIEQAKSRLRKIKGIYHNTAWSYNYQDIEEIIGSSQNLANQEFSLEFSPNHENEFELWVNESTFLSEEEKETLELKKLVKRIPQADQIWIRWNEVHHLDQSKPGDRHFVIDKVGKKIFFGDGIHGKIPPPGLENIKVKYTFGGGKLGNLPSHSINKLKTAVPFVESITNPLPAEGGLDSESIAKAILRGPQTIKNRGRSITSEDFEWIVLENFPSVAKTKCLPSTNQHGNIEGGHISLVVVPNSKEQKPMPTQTLLENITGFLKDSSDMAIPRNSIHVIPPTFIRISIKVTLKPISISAFHQAETKALSLLQKFLHPLSGKKDGSGWKFGELVCMAEIFELLNNIPEIDHLDDLAIHGKVEGNSNDEFVINSFESAQEIPPYSLIYGGQHEIRPSTGGTL